MLGNRGFEGLEDGLDTPVELEGRRERTGGKPMEPSWVQASWFIQARGLAFRLRAAAGVDA